MKSYLKTFFRKIGLFTIVRNIYRSINREHREKRSSYKIFFNQLINKEDLCFDIGANLGQTIEALIASDAIVVAAEPNPLCHQTLQSQFKKSKDVTIVKKALGSSVGFAELNFKGTNATASIRNDWGFETEGKVQVKVTTLDNMIEEFGVPKLLKVDVEGYEYEVFKGLTTPIELIYFEVHGKEMDLAMKVLDRLEEIGELEGVKVLSGHNSNWLVNQWSKPDELLNKLGDPLPRHANFLVKMKV